MEDEELLKIIEKLAEGCRYIGGEWDKTTDSCKKKDTIIRVSRGMKGGADVEIRSGETTVYIQDLKSSEVISKEDEEEVKTLKLTLLGDEFDTIIKVDEFGMIDVNIGEELE